MPRDEDRARDEFTSEAEELLDTVARDLRTLEAQGANVRPELVNKIFREVHSLKGLAGMLGLARISDLAHGLEDMLDRLRMGRLEVSKELIDLLYDAIDMLNRLLVSADTVDVAPITSRIQQMVSRQQQGKGDDPLAALALDEQTRRSLTEYEEHRLFENVRGNKQIVSVEARFDFSDFDQKLRALTSRLSEVGEVVSTLPAVDNSGNGIAFRLLCGTDLDQESVAALAPEANVISLRKPLPPPETTEEEVSLRSISPTVRVDIAKLDAVMNIVGELLIEKTRLEAHTGATGGQAGRVAAYELQKISRTIDRKLNEMQKSVVEMRLVPVGQIYTKLARTVRKVARELNKQIELVLRGEDTELDKRMVEELTDPLMHIIRNALDHGIESAQERQAAGKPPAGQVTLLAYQQGNSVVLDVTDDGRGIDPQIIRRVALQRGLISEEEPVDDQRAYELLFTPGFSTASAVSEISGRGVGLDVVKKNIQDLKGSIDVLSVVGRGTTFRIRLPITLAILQALIVRAAGELFAIPLTSVDESLRIVGRDIHTVERREVFTLRQTTIPLLRLSDVFHLEDQRVDDGDRKWFVVVTRVGEKVFGLLVDALVRQHEVVIKTIGERLKSIPGVAGATEIGEGEIVLVIDVASLIEAFGGKARDMRAKTGLTV
ncbi:MAG: chemotaxis protein CheA [Acidobacteria bacterium]|nr:MAG: chemotaxis protein CheA [Acidobacteriota bacterium]